MPCNFVRMPDGGTAIVCTRGRKIKPCAFCGVASEVLCDYPVNIDGKPGTCDAPCCRQHAVSVGRDRDYCKLHAKGEAKP